MADPTPETRAEDAAAAAEDAAAAAEDAAAAAEDALPLAERLLSSFDLSALLSAGLMLAGGVVAGLFLGRLVDRTLRKTGSSVNLADLGRRTAKGLCVGLGLALALEQLGFDLGVLLGAAGVASVALGFAAQTSVSNLISGAFLLVEQSIQVGDIIQIGQHSGEVLSVDLLSLKLRTFDNKRVRVPNEQVLKTEVLNMSAFPIRRIDLVLTVPPTADLDAVDRVLLQAADERREILLEPAPQTFYGPFGPDGMDVKLACWTRREIFVKVNKELYKAVRSGLLASGYTFAVPRRVLVGDAAAAPVSMLLEPPELPLDPDAEEPASAEDDPSTEAAPAEDPPASA